MPLTLIFRLAGEATETVILDVSSMKCGGCSASVKRILMGMPGVESAAVNLLTECAVVQYDSSSGQATAGSLTETLTSKVSPCLGLGGLSRARRRLGNVWLHVRSIYILLRMWRGKSRARTR